MVPRLSPRQVFAHLVDGMFKFLRRSSSRGGTRTPDPVINSQVRSRLTAYTPTVSPFGCKGKTDPKRSRYSPDISPDICWLLLLSACASPFESPAWIPVQRTAATDSAAQIALRCGVSDGRLPVRS